ncbi:unnamed protein product [Acanthoscelides obtectus]|uniref:C2H2-type domain-containing protein n=1 Tax=Acanthoscelides obtectus TaxID=200917 RepID=A0A9P0QH31_ACAOB|nr:unnamed protein product [Acanthoscelides obtectus]CAK1682457.1 hypothetical protein AOBTE_LOCUS33642 [Acanthoscelides obtectus]
MFQCPKCQRTFAVRKSLLRHCRARCSQDEEPASKRPCNATAPRSTADKWECPRCRQKFSARKGLLRHGREVCTSEKSPPEQQRVEASITQTTTGLNTRRLDPSTANVAIPGPSRMSPTTSNDSQTSAESRTIRCDSCNCEVPRNAHAAHLKSIKHKAHLWTPLHNNVSVCRSAFRGRIVSYQITASIDTLNVTEYMNNLEHDSINVIENELHKQTTLKINMELFGLYILPAKSRREVKSHNTNNVIITQSSNLKAIYHDLESKIEQKSEDFAEKDSGWVLEKTLYLEININKYNPLRAASYLPLPKEIRNKKAVLNIRNNDEYCFAWSIVAGMVKPKGRSSLTTSYLHFSNVPGLNFAGMTFPVALKSISECESVNNISSNVYGLEKEFIDGKPKYQVLGPLHYTAQKQHTHLNLLLIDDSEGNHHYCLITNFSRLVSIKVPKLETRVNRLGNTVMDNILKCEQHHKQLRLPFCVYTDFECILAPIENDSSDSEDHQYSNKVSLAYTDTDSLIVHVETDNFYEDMKSHVHYFDTSNYDADNPHNMPRTASELGKMKDEYGGKVLSAFYGTGPTAYCIDAVDQVAG